MSEFVGNCPRCGSKNITFDLIQNHLIEIRTSWVRYFEAFCICRHCSRSTVFVLSQKKYDERDYISQYGLLNFQDSVNNHVNEHGFINLKDRVTIQPPDYLPENIDDMFREGAACMSIKCFNAAGTMFRLCLDLSTREMLPKDNVDGLNQKIRRNLGLRLPWLFKKGILPEALRDLSECIKDDGNDGAHEGSLTEPDAEDLLDFTCAMLERIYTEPERLRLAKERRQSRRRSSDD